MDPFGLCHSDNFVEIGRDRRCHSCPKMAPVVGLFDFQDFLGHMHT